MPNGNEDVLLKLLPDSAVALFAYFARFELALKKTRYLKTLKNDCRRAARTKDFPAEANWDGFADNLGDSFLNEIRESGRVTVLLVKPPRKQVVNASGLYWKTTKPVTSVREMFVAIRRVRNNLFHGGKFAIPVGSLPSVNPDGDDDRDDALIRDALEILKMALEKEPKVKAAFFEGLREVTRAP